MSAEAPPSSQPSTTASSLRSTFRRASDSGVAEAQPVPASTLQAPVLLANWTADQDVTGLAWLEGHTLAAVFEQGAQTTIRLFTPGASELCTAHGNLQMLQTQAARALVWDQTLSLRPGKKLLCSIGELEGTAPGGSSPA